MCTFPEVGELILTRILKVGTPLMIAVAHATLWQHWKSYIRRRVTLVMPDLYYTIELTFTLNISFFLSLLETISYLEYTWKVCIWRNINTYIYIQVKTSKYRGSINLWLGKGCGTYHFSYGLEFLVSRKKCSYSITSESKSMKDTINISHFNLSHIYHKWLIYIMQEK